MSTVTFGPWVGRITHGTYDNGRAALRLIGKMGPIATCTVNLFDKKMEQDEVAIKDYAENEGMLDALMDAGGCTASPPIRPCHDGQWSGSRSHL